MRNRLGNASIAQHLDERPSDGETAIPTRDVSKRAAPRKLRGRAAELDQPCRSNVAS